MKSLPQGAEASDTSLPQSAEASDTYRDIFHSLYPLKSERGRDVRAGQLRGWGIEFGNLIHNELAGEHVWEASLDAARQRGTLLNPAKLANLYLILRYGMADARHRDIIEFGSFRGGSAVFLATMLRELALPYKVYALDTFSGMPKTNAMMDLHNEGDFRECDHDGLLEFIERNRLSAYVETVKGRFDQTLPRLIAQGHRFGLAHCDCDVYDAVKYVCANAPDYMADGGYIAFDDPLHGSCLGAFTAVEEEFIQRRSLLAEQAFPHLIYRVQPLR
jgi:hypothetical protein